MTAAPWMVGVPWDPDSPAEASSRRLIERVARDKEERRREERMTDLKNAALLRRHVMLQTQAIAVEIGLDPATLPPVPSLEAIELERPEALGVPLEKIADLVFAEQDAVDGAKRRARDREEVRLPGPTPPPPLTEAARSSRVALRSRIRAALSRSPAERVPAVELEPREVIR
jgi:hypothetical protein